MSSGHFIIAYFCCIIFQQKQHQMGSIDQTLLTRQSFFHFHFSYLPLAVQKTLSLAVSLNLHLERVLALYSRSSTLYDNNPSLIIWVTHFFFSLFLLSKIRRYSLFGILFLKYIHCSISFSFLCFFIYYFLLFSRCSQFCTFFLLCHCR